MPTAAVNTKLVLFERALGGSPDAFETIGEVNSFDGPSMNASPIDVTSFDSTWKEKLIGVPDGGQVTIGFNWVPGNGPQQRLREDFENGTLRAYRLRKADATLPAISFSGYVAAIAPSGAVDSAISGSATIEITGEVN